MLWSSRSLLQHLCPIGNPVNAQQTWVSLALDDALIWRRGGESGMLLSVGRFCFLYTEKKLSDEKLGGIASGGPPETPSNLIFPVICGGPGI